MSPMLRTTVFITVYLIVSAYASGRGGTPERRAVAILTIGMLLTWMLISPIGRRFHGPEIGVAIADAITLCGLVWLALTADRFWPLWLAAMQAVVVLSHAAMILKPVTLPAYYKNTIQLWIYPQLGLLVIGTLRERLRTQPSPMERTIGRMAAELAGAWRRCCNVFLPAPPCGEK